jgi:hypothetical protein
VKKNTEPERRAGAADPKKHSHVKKPASIEAEAESAAARDEPMGSIAAAIPGSNQAAEDVMKHGKLPGAEAPEIRDEPETTAGTEAKREGEEPASA